MIYQPNHNYQVSHPCDWIYARLPA